jgi:hypothetical protein
MSDISLHIVTRLRGAALLAMNSDRTAGRQVHVLLLHDEVYRAVTARTPACDRLLLGADDCRRRGLPLGDGAVEYPAIVDAIASASRVITW